MRFSLGARLRRRVRCLRAVAFALSLGSQAMILTVVLLDGQELDLEVSELLSGHELRRLLARRLWKPGSCLAIPQLRLEQSLRDQGWKRKGETGLKHRRGDRKLLKMTEKEARRQDSRRFK